jgi:FdhD protein
MDQGSVEAEWHEFGRGWERKTDLVIGEAMTTIYVNGLELATIMCTPWEQDLLALGFLRNEGLIDRYSEIDHVHVGGNGCCVDVWLTHVVEKPELRIITSGCGTGVTFKDPTQTLDPLHDELTIEPEALIALFNRLHTPESLHARAGGIHTAGLTDGDEQMLIAEDIGRHNTIDRLAGVCLVKDLDTRGLILITTGRVSSEMLRKAYVMGCPIVASRTSPTSLSLQLANAAGITLVGYARRGKLRAYTHPYRLGLDSTASAAP